MRTLLLAAGVATCLQAQVWAQRPNDFHSQVMDSTFKIQGPDGKTYPDGQSHDACGTGFLIGPGARDVGFAMITAKHVLENIKSQTADLYLRVRDERQQVRGLVQRIQIRSGEGTSERALYTSHPTADVAAMRVSLPANHAMTFTTNDALATDDVFLKLEVHAGDDMLAVGYPNCNTADALGNPVLRKGPVATRVTRPPGTFLLDLPGIGGNSGGPVYFEFTQRFYGNIFHDREISRYIAGIVTQGSPTLQLAGVIPARFILETIALLPPQ